MSGKRIVKDLSDLGALLSGEALPESPQQRPDSTPDRATRMVTLTVRLETKGRKGKGMTVVEGFFHTPEDLEQIARKIKNACAAGGTVKESAIEIQGDHRHKVGELLEAMGFKVKIRR